MGSKPWLAISVLILLVLFLALFVLKYRARNKRHKQDYYSWFVIGMFWTAIGIFIDGMEFFAVMGFAFMFAALTHKPEWKKNRRTWKSKSERERNIVLVVMGILLLVVVAAAFLLSKSRC